MEDVAANQLVSNLADKGFAITPVLISHEECELLAKRCGEVAQGLAGSRNLLEQPWCRELANRLQLTPTISAALPDGAIPVQCIFFDKNPERNWLVPFHQDLSIPVEEESSHSELTGWSRKEGVLYVQPPACLLGEMLAVRLQLDESEPDDGLLRVIPESHKHGRLKVEKVLELRTEFGETVCDVPRGASLLMRPLLLHASSKSTGLRPRRVLHFLFGPRQLPFGLSWPREAR